MKKPTAPKKHVAGTVELWFAIENEYTNLIVVNEDETVEFMFSNGSWLKEDLAWPRKWLLGEWEFAGYL